jgi:hypothetical protein
VLFQIKMLVGMPSTQLLRRVHISIAHQQGFRMDRWRIRYGTARAALGAT